MRINLNKFSRNGMIIGLSTIAIIGAMLIAPDKIEGLIPNPIFNTGNPNQSDGYKISLNKLINNETLTTSSGSELTFDCSIGVGVSNDSILIPSGGTIRNVTAISGISEILTEGLTNNLIVSYGWRYNEYKTEQCLLSSTKSSTDLYELKPSYFEIKNSSGEDITLSYIDVCYSCSASSEYTISQTALSFTKHGTYYGVSQNPTNRKNYTNVIIPEIYDELPVLSIDTNTFLNAVNLKTIRMSSIKEISQSAFKGCSSLVNIDLGKQITTLGLEAFYNCSNSNAYVYIPSSVTKVGSRCFGGWNGTIETEISTDPLPNGWASDWR